MEIFWPADRNCAGVWSWSFVAQFPKEFKRHMRCFVLNDFDATRTDPFLTYTNHNSNDSSSLQNN